MEQAEGNNKIVLKILSTLLVMYILTGAALFLLAFLLYKMELTENIVTIGIMVIYVVSGLVGGIIIGKRMKTRRFLWGILIGGAYFVVLLIGFPADESGNFRRWTACWHDIDHVHGSRDDRRDGELSKKSSSHALFTKYIFSAFALLHSFFSHKTARPSSLCIQITPHANMIVICDTCDE